MEARHPYPSDVSEPEWQLIKPLLDSALPPGPGRPCIHSKREIVNAIFYLDRAGCAGACSRMAFRPGEPYMDISACGETLESGRP
jgi:transposase